MTVPTSALPCEAQDASARSICSRWSTHRHVVHPDEIIHLCDKHACAKCVRYRGDRTRKKKA